MCKEEWLDSVFYYTYEVKYFLQTGKIITTNKSAGLTVVAGDDRGSYTTTVQVKYNPTALQTD